MRVKTGDISGEEPMVDPPGKKVGIVLKGSLKVNINDKDYQLNAGDGIYYPANVPHSWMTLEGKEILVIWILTPPS